MGKIKFRFDYEVLNECAKTYANWIEEIRNSLLVPYSNGVMEGYNNKIKVLKRIAFARTSPQLLTKNQIKNKKNT